MSSRRPSTPRGPSRPTRPTRSRATDSAPTGAPRLHSKGTRRALIIGGDKGKPRALSMRVLAVLLSIIFAVILITPALRNYLSQQAEIRQLNASVELARARNDDLAAQLALWNDPEYVAAQARERLGYVSPGQVLYVVTDPDEDTAEERRAALEEELNYNRRAATPWFTTLWDSVAIAGYASGQPSEPINPAGDPGKDWQPDDEEAPQPDPDGEITGPEQTPGGDEGVSEAP